MESLLSDTTCLWHSCPGADNVPDFSELTQEKLYETRERLVDYIRVKFDDVDLNPNTVVGDLIVTPQTYTIAALETGMERFMSDLDLGNVAEDVIWNCDFVPGRNVYNSRNHYI